MTNGTEAAILGLLAHQGGWDEILVVLAPMLILVGLLVLATRRVNAKLADTPNAQAGDDAAQGQTSSSRRSTEDSIQS